MRIVAARHPVIEKLTEREAGRFIPNDLYLKPETEFIAVITGPNMGGKSTYLRQAALIAILAQTGSYVPAEQRRAAHHRSRIHPHRRSRQSGARPIDVHGGDDRDRRHPEYGDRNSLIVLDEIGRGTSTYDGLALAWAVVEHIHQRIRAKTLFATHYHELTELADQLTGVRNLHVSVKEAGDQMIFLRRVEPGRADRSYGIEVARLAGLPSGVIERAAQHSRAA